jgi:very-short-patch-repair endonuclease
VKFETLTGTVKQVKRPKKYLVKWKGKSRSKRQRAVKLFLREYWQDHIVFEEFPVVGTRMSFDFYNASKKIAIEVQGRQHTEYVPFFHRTKMNYLSQLKRDQEKSQFCILNDILLLEIYDGDPIDESFFKKNKVFL